MTKKEYKEIKAYYNKHYKGMLLKTILGLLFTSIFYSWIITSIIEKI